MPTIQRLSLRNSPANPHTQRSKDFYTILSSLGPVRVDELSSCSMCNFACSGYGSACFPWRSAIFTRAMCARIRCRQRSSAACFGRACLEAPDFMNHSCRSVCTERRDIRSHLPRIRWHPFGSLSRISISLVVRRLEPTTQVGAQKMS